MRQYRQNDREIRLTTLLLRTLEHWRIILIFSLIFCVLGAGYRGMKMRRDLGNIDPAAAQEQYEKALAAYETDRDSYQKTIKKVRADLQAKREYLNSSVLAEIDPYAEAIAQYDIFLRADGEQKDVLTTVSAEYRAFLANGIDWNALAEEMETETRFLQELINVNEQNGTIHIYVRHSDMERARRIAEYMLEQLPKKEQEIRDRGLQYEAQITEISTAVIADSNMFKWLDSRISELNTLQNNLSKTEDAQQKLTRPAVPAGLSRREVIKSIGKYAAAGLIGGCVFIVLVIALLLVARGRVLSAEELGRTFGLRGIAVLPEHVRKKGALDRLIVAKDREQGSFTSEDARFDAAAANLAQYAGGARRILVTGCAPEATLSGVAEKLAEKQEDRGFSICPQGDTAAFCAALRDADGIIVVEEKGRSRYADIEPYIALVRDWDKPIFGSICIY